MQFKFGSCFKEMKSIKTINITIVFDVTPLNKADSDFTAR